MYKFSDLINDFRNIHRDPSTLNNKYFSDAEILEWLCDATLEMIREAGLLTFTSTLNLIAGVAEYAFPVGIEKIVRIIDADGKRILPTTVDVLDGSDDTWADQSGEVELYYQTRQTGNSANKDIGFWKKPSTSSVIRITGWKCPAVYNAQSASASMTVSQTPELDDMVVKLALDYALAKGYEKKRMFTERDKAINKFYSVNIKMAKNFWNREEDALTVMGRNEGSSQGGKFGSMPDPWFDPTTFNS